jgi:hypothetical protein
MTSVIMTYMIYTFSWGWFFIGIIVLAASVALTVWYRVIADNFGNGVSSYDRYRLWGLIGCGLGFIVMLNLHTYLLVLFFSQLFGR